MESESSDATAEAEGPANGSSNEVAVSVRNLTKVYGEDTYALDGIDFDIEKGSVVGLLGPNGAGKTTCIKSILGLVSPTDGSSTVCGIDTHENPTELYKNAGGVLEGARNVYWRLTVRENLEFFASITGKDPAEMREKHDRLLEQFGLLEKADEQVNELSRGMKQKVTLAATLSRDVDVAFLDEPTLGLDVESSFELQRELRRLADQNSMTLVLSSHDMQVIENICDRVIILNGGSVITDQPVDDLIDLFKTKTYRITVEDGISESTEQRLADEFGVDEWEEVGQHVRFEVSLQGGEKLSALLDAILNTGHDIHEIHSVDPNLEDIFLELTGDANSSGDSSATEVSDA